MIEAWIGQYWGGQKKKKMQETWWRKNKAGMGFHIDMKGKCDRMKYEVVHLLVRIMIWKNARNILWQILCPDWKMRVEISSQLLNIDTWNFHFVWDALISSSIPCFCISSLCLKGISRLSSLWTLSAQCWIWKHSRCSKNTIESTRIVQIIVIAVFLCL